MDEDSSFLGIVFIILLIWGGKSLYNHFWGEKNDYTSSSSYSSSYSDNSASSRQCMEPENPYDYDSGHYAGFEWGENGNSCSGDSDSFVEGCEEYESQEDSYQMCLNQN